MSTLLLTALTVLLWGLIPIFDKLALSQFSASPLVGIAIRTVAVSVFTLPLAATIGNGAATMKAMPPMAIALFVASGLASLLLSQYSYYSLLQRADVSRVFPFLFSAAPVVTILVGVFAMGETMTLKQVLGILLVIGGGLLLL